MEDSYHFNYSDAVHSGITSYIGECGEEVLHWLCNSVKNDYGVTLHLSDKIEQHEERTCNRAVANFTSTSLQIEYLKNPGVILKDEDTYHFSFGLCSNSVLSGDVTCLPEYVNEFLCRWSDIGKEDCLEPLADKIKQLKEQIFSKVVAGESGNEPSHQWSDLLKEDCLVHLTDKVKQVEQFCSKVVVDGYGDKPYLWWSDIKEYCLAFFIDKTKQQMCSRAEYDDENFQWPDLVKEDFCVCFANEVEQFEEHVCSRVIPCDYGIEPFHLLCERIRKDLSTTLECFMDKSGQLDHNICSREVADECDINFFFWRSNRVQDNCSVILTQLKDKIEQQQQQIYCYSSMGKSMIQFAQQKAHSNTQISNVKCQLFQRNQKLTRRHFVSSEMHTSLLLSEREQLCHLNDFNVKTMGDEIFSDIESVCSDLLLSGVSLEGSHASLRVQAQLHGGHILLTLMYKKCRVCICGDFSKTFPQVICPTYSMCAENCHYKMYGHIYTEPVEFLKVLKCFYYRKISQCSHDNCKKSFSSLTKSCSHVHPLRLQFTHSNKCQCGICSLLALFTQSCPNSFHLAFYFTCFGGEAASDSTLPFDCGIFLQQSVTQTIVGVTKQKFSTAVCSVDEGVKNFRSVQAVNKISAHGRASSSYEPLSVLKLVFYDSNLNCNDKIFHTACSMPSGRNNFSDYLKPKLQSRWHYCSVADPSTSHCESLPYLFECLSVLQQCAHDFYAALITHSLIILAGNVELNPGPNGKCNVLLNKYHCILVCVDTPIFLVISTLCAF